MCVLRYGGKALCKRVENVAQTYEKKIILYLNDLRSTSGRKCFVFVCMLYIFFSTSPFVFIDRRQITVV